MILEALGLQLQHGHTYYVGAFVPFIMPITVRYDIGSGKKWSNMHTIVIIQHSSGKIMFCGVFGYHAHWNKTPFKSCHFQRVMDFNNSLSHL